LKYFVEAGAMAVRRCKKVDLKRIAKCTGAHFVTSLANLEGEESFEAAFLGRLILLSTLFKVTLARMFPFQEKLLKLPKPASAMKS
jgi:hypothetical protein